MYRDDKTPLVPRIWMPRGLALAVLLVAVLLFGACSVVDRVDPGYMGIKVDYNKNTTDQIGSGQWVMVGPGQKLIEYPIAQIQTILDWEDKNDESVFCPTRDGVQLRVDAKLFWRADESELVALFNLNTGMPLTSKPGGDIESKVVRTIMPAAIQRACGNYTWREIYAGKTVEAETAMRDAIKAGLDSQHLRVDQFVLGKVHLPPAQLEQANQIIAAEQSARVAEFNTRKIQEEAKATQAQAQAANEANRIAAEGQAAIAKVNAERDAAVAKVLADQNAVVAVTRAQGELKAAESSAASVKVLADAAAYQQRVEGDAKASALAAQANAVKGNREYVDMLQAQKWDGKRVPEKEFVYGPNAVVAPR